jgi:hypothetical protein
MRSPWTLDEPARWRASCGWILVAWLSFGGGCATRGASGPPPGVDSDPRAALERFAAAVDGGRWEEAYPLLSARWRVRSTPELLAGDLAASGVVGAEAVRRVRALLAAGTPLRLHGESAALGVGEDKAARLVREGDAWRVDALE